MGRFLVVDGTYLLYRGFHSKSGWDLSHNDIRTGGAFVFLKTLHQTLERVSDINRVVVVWDGKRSSRRKEIYPEYKANRDKRPPVMRNGQEVDVHAEMNAQRTLLEEAFSHVGVRVAHLPYREGDDVIYALTRLTGRSVVLSDDKDMLAMLRPTVNVYQPSKETYYTWDGFKEEFQFDPDLYIYYKAITGDTSDNIKGVKGAGEKTAEVFCARLQELGKDVDAALTECVTSKNKRVAAIAEQKGVLDRNLLLVDCSHESFSAEELAALRSVTTNPANVNREAFFEFCRRVGFHSMNNHAWVQPFARLV
jgi:DNA polymerase I